jgi:hypothetical protein
MNTGKNLARRTRGWWGRCWLRWRRRGEQRGQSTGVSAR